MQCTARRASDGQPCTRRAIAGGRVCPTHGGQAPQVKAKARERILAMVDPALGVLSRAMKLHEKGGKEKPSPLAVMAARDILDRAGYKGTDKLQVSGIISGSVTVDARDALRARVEALHERLIAGANSGTPGTRTNGSAAFHS